MWLSIILIFTQGNPHPKAIIGPRFIDLEFCEKSIAYALEENIIPTLEENQYAEGTCYLYEDKDNPIIDL
jgi:hypothetical protein